MDKPFHIIFCHHEGTRTLPITLSSDKLGFPVYMEIVQHGNQLFERLHEVKPDLVLSFDPNPLLHALDVIMLAKEEYPELPVIVVGTETPYDRIVHFITVGADDFVYVDHPMIMTAVIRKIRKRTPHFSQPYSAQTAAPVFVSRV